MENFSQQGKMFETMASMADKLKDTIKNMNVNTARKLLVEYLWSSNNYLEGYSKFKLKGYNTEQILYNLCCESDINCIIQNRDELRKLISKLIEDGNEIKKAHVLSCAIFSSLLMFELLYEFKPELYDERVLQICVQNNFIKGTEFMLNNIKFNNEIIQHIRDFAKTNGLNEIYKILNRCDENIEEKLNTLLSKLDDNEKELLNELLKGKDRKNLNFKDLMNQFAELLGNFI